MLHLHSRGRVTNAATFHSVQDLSLVSLALPTPINPISKIPCPEANLIKIIPCQHAQELVCLVILDPVKLRININHNPVLEACGH